MVVEGRMMKKQWMLQSEWIKLSVHLTEQTRAEMLFYM